MFFDPCKANIYSMCPLKSTTPITGFVVVGPLAPSMTTGIPTIALGIPDFEAYARLQIFANSTQTEIGCFQAVMTNGSTMSQPDSVAALLALCTLLAFIASFLTAIYGVRITAMRTHYANSFSLLVVLDTFQSFFYAGALNVAWPSILPAWWSNFAWTAGLFAPPSMVKAMKPFTGIRGNTSQAGEAGSVTLNNGGGLAQQIYGRSLLRALSSGITRLMRRSDQTPSNLYDYKWAGHPVTPGLPMPGTWPGFGGTLSLLKIPAADAFIIGFIWLCATLLLLAIFVLFAKLVLDWGVKYKWLRDDGFDYFRSHVWGYLGAIMGRALFVYFFSTMTLVMYQLSTDGATGPTAIAAVVFILFFCGLSGVIAYACYVRLREGKFAIKKDTLRLESGTIFKYIPFITVHRESTAGEKETLRKPLVFGSIRFFRIEHTPNGPDQLSVHQDEWYIKRYGWLSARYRRSRWWFFAYYLGYQFVRAVFLGAGSRTPMAQIYGLLVFDVLAFYAIIKMKPFEGARNTAVAVWLLSLSKIVTTGVSIAFLPAWNLDRILATVIAFIIIVSQGFLAIAVVILMILGMISSWMSVTRNREEFPEMLYETRTNYFEHIAQRAGDMPRKPKEKKPKKPKKPKKREAPAPPPEPSFNVREVRRVSKIEDEDADRLAEIMSLANEAGPSTGGNPRNRHSRANSASSRYSTSSLPRAARVHRASWSSKDFAHWDAEMNRSEQQRISWARSELARPPSAVAAQEGQRHMSIRRPMTPANEASEYLLSKERSKEEGDRGKATGVLVAAEDKETRP